MNPSSAAGDRQAPVRHGREEVPGIRALGVLGERQLVEGVGTDGLAGQVGRDDDGQTGEGVADLDQAGALGRVPRAPPRVRLARARLRGGVGEDPVDDHRVDDEAVEAEGGPGAPGLGDDHALGGQHEPHGGEVAGQQPLHLAQVPVPARHHLEHLRGRQRHAGRGGRSRAQRPDEPALGRQQAVEVPGERLGQGEQAQRLGGGRAVDDDEVPWPRLDLRPQLEERGDLVGPRQRGELLGDDGVDAEGAEHAQEVVLHHPPGAVEGVWRADLQGREARARPRPAPGGAAPPEPRCGWAREVDVEGVAERVGRVGRHDQGLDAGPGGPDSGGGGGRGLSDPALAGEEDDAHAANQPTVRESRPQPSTRFFSSLSAVSMMTFSALRLSIPSIGTLTSTASR